MIYLYFQMNLIHVFFSSGNDCDGIVHIWSFAGRFTVLLVLAASSPVMFGRG